MFISNVYLVLLFSSLKFLFQNLFYNADNYSCNLASAKPLHLGLF